jgi:hypothetical protein
MGADCKSAGYAYARFFIPKLFRPRGSVVEHILGKDEVMSSILIAGLLETPSSRGFRRFEGVYCFCPLLSNL